MADPTAATPAEGGPFDGRSWLPRSVRDSYAQRPVARRRAEVSRWYARFYAPLAVVASVVGLLPLYDRVVTVGDVPVRATVGGNLVSIAVTSGDGFSQLGLGLLAGLVGLLVRACVRVITPVIPVLLAVLAATALVLLLVFDLHPDSQVVLSGAGVGAVVVAAWTLVLGIAHAVHLRRVTAESTTV